MNAKQRRLFFPIAFLALVVVGLIMFIIVGVYNHLYGMKYVSSKETAPELAEDEYNIVFKGEYNGKAVLYDDYLYLDMDLVNEDWAMGRFFYADTEDVVFFTTSTERIRSEVGGDFYKERDGKIYVRASECEDKCGIQYSINYDEQMVMIRDPEGRVADVMKSGIYLLTEPDPEVKTYTAKLKKGQTIEIYDCDTEGYYFAMDFNGHMGYVPQEVLKTSKANLSRKESQKVDMEDYDVKSDHIFMVFHQRYTNEFNYDVYMTLEDSWYYTNVVCPTWFKVNTDGSVSTLANADYVDSARELGSQVWGLFDNRFDNELTYDLLSRTEIRDRICQSLLKYCKQYKLHGINVDFEGLTAETERYFMQFLRELSIVLRQEGFLLSVDVPVPSPWSEFYQRKRYADVCDYIIVMAYDEHYGGSEVAGSTASRPFTEAACQDMLDEGIPSRKILLGIPWYTRVWIGEGDDMETEAIGMDETWDLIYEYDLTVEYDEETGQNYAHGYWDGELYQIWLEDETSLKFRLDAVKNYDLKGVAAWSYGFENWQVWEAYDAAFWVED